MELINASLNSYSECEEDDGGGCGCHAPTLREDLEPWVQRGAIQWEEFAAAQQNRRSGLVHYQVVNHTLFRQQECMFRFRYVSSETLYQTNQQQNGVTF